MWYDWLYIKCYYDKHFEYWWLYIIVVHIITYSNIYSLNRRLILFRLNRSTVVQLDFQRFQRVMYKNKNKRWSDVYQNHWIDLNYIF